MVVYIVVSVGEDWTIHSVHTTREAAEQTAAGIKLLDSEGNFDEVWVEEREVTE